jgi:hypothetical protein
VLPCTFAAPTTHSLNEKGLYDYLLLNDDLDATAAELERIAEVSCLSWFLLCLNGRNSSTGVTWSAHQQKTCNMDRLLCWTGSASQAHVGLSLSSTRLCFIVCCLVLQRAMRGLPAEPGQVPDEVRFEEDEDGEDEQAAAARASSGAGASTSNAAAAAAAGLAAAALPAFNAISTTPRPHDHLSPRAVLPGHPEPAAGARNVLGETVERPQTSGTPSAQHQHAAAGPAAAAGQRMVTGLQAWRGKVAVVTGASSGIGWSVCEALGRAGLRVVAVARRR